jgi:hypothetical protein
MTDSVGDKVTDPKIVEEVYKLAEKTDNHDTLDPEVRKKLKILRSFKFLDEIDVFERFPEEYKDDLEYDKESGIFTWNGYIVLTQDMVYDILVEEHLDIPDNMGTHKFYTYLSQRYIGISANQVTKFLNTSMTHQEWRVRHRSQKTIPFVPPKPFSEISCDITYLPKRMNYKYIFVVVESFSKYVWATLLNTMDDDTVSEVLSKNIESMRRVPSTIRADNGFRGERFKMLAASLGFKWKWSAPGNPLATGGVESANKSVKTAFMSYLNDEMGRNKIADALRRVLVIYNQSVHSSTGFRPRDLIDKDVPVSIIKEAKENLKMGASKRDLNKKYNFTLLPGDKVKVDVLLLSTRLRRAEKSNRYKASHQATYSEEDYTVDLCKADGLYTLKELPGRVFLRGQLLYLPSIENRRDFVMKWQGDRDESGLPRGREDVHGLGTDRQKAAGKYGEATYRGRDELPAT